MSLAGSMVAMPLPFAAGADLMEVYELALENDDTFSAARNEFKGVQQSEKQAFRRWLFPNLSASYDHTETEQEIISSENEVFGQGETSFPTDEMTVSLTQPIFRWDYFVDREIAKAEVRQAEYSFAASEQELMLRAAESYLNALAAQDAVAVAEAEAAAIERQMNRAERRLDVGMANATEVHESRARYQLTQSDLIEARTNRVDAMEGVRVIAGTTPAGLAPLSEGVSLVPPDPPEVQHWVDRALENNFNIQAAEAAVEVAQEEQSRQKADLFPTLNVVASYNKRDTGGSLFGGGSEVDTAEVILRARWDFFQGGTVWARNKEAWYEIQRAKDELALQRKQTRRRTRNAFLGVMNGISRVEALKASMEAQAQTVDAKQKGFETGANSNLEVLDAQRDFYLARRDHLQARYDYLLDVLDLKRQVGALSPADLKRINGMLAEAGVEGS